MLTWCITQLFAKGGEDGPEHNRAHRLVNAWEFSKLVRMSALCGRYVIAVRIYFVVHSTAFAVAHTYLL